MNGIQKYRAAGAVLATLVTLGAGVGVAATRVYPPDSTLAQAALRTVREAPSIRSIVPEVPDALASVIEKCLARDPRKRWKNAALLRLALLRIQNRERRSHLAPMAWCREVVNSWTLRPAPVRRMARIA